MRIKIIAFTGKMGAGKSEAIRTLESYLAKSDPSTTVKLVKFAQALYDIQGYIYKRVRKPVPTTASGEAKDRRLLQWIGTDWGREKDVSLWVDLWELDVKEQLESLEPNKTLLVVCDDCRFDNEANKVKEMGGVVVKITTDKNGERIDLSGASHLSEKGVSDTHLDFVIENNRTLEDYKNQLTYLFKKLGL